VARFEKNKSGNPGGRPGRPRALAEWRKSDEAARLRDLSYKALEDAVTANDIDWRDRNTAAGMLLDRIEGKPMQSIAGDDGGAIKVENSSGLMGVLTQLDVTEGE
jgi:hypothetical protein